MPQTIQYFQDSQIFDEASRLLSNQSRDALAAVYAFVYKARDIANGRDADAAAKKLAEFEAQTVRALEGERAHSLIINNFAKAYSKYTIDPECVEVLFAALRMDTTHTTFTPHEYKIYVAGVGEATALMALKILCYKRAVLYHKLEPEARAFGAAICKINLLLEHGQTHKRHGRMYFPDVTKATFNQVRLAQVLVNVESDFRTARPGISMLPPGTRRAASLIYVYFYEYLRQMRHVTPSDIDAGKVSITNPKLIWLALYTYVAPVRALQRSRLG